MMFAMMMMCMLYTICSFNLHNRDYTKMGDYNIGDYDGDYNIGDYDEWWLW